MVVPLLASLTKFGCCELRQVLLLGHRQHLVPLLTCSVIAGMCMILQIQDILVAPMLYGTLFDNNSVVDDIYYQVRRLSG